MSQKIILQHIIAHKFTRRKLPLNPPQFRDHVPPYPKRRADVEPHQLPKGFNRQKNTANTRPGRDGEARGTLPTPPGLHQSAESLRQCNVCVERQDDATVDQLCVAEDEHDGKLGFGRRLFEVCWINRLVALNWTDCV